MTMKCMSCFDSFNAYLKRFERKSNCYFVHEYLVKQNVGES